MAYVQLTNELCADKAQMFCNLRDFICKRNGTYNDYSTTGIGWTLHDSSYATDENNPIANDWFVVYSAGEGGKDDMYCYFTWVSSTYINFKGYLYWNNTTHAGVDLYGGSNNFAVGTGIQSLYIWGDLNSFLTLKVDGTTEIVGWFGKTINPAEDDTICTYTGSVSSGTDISIPFDNAVPTNWEVGRNVFIRDNANIEIITIKTISTNTITADLVNSYTNPKGSNQPLYMVSNSIYSLGSSAKLDALIGQTGTIGDIISAPQDVYGIPELVDPDPLNDEWGIFSLHLGATAGGYFGMFEHVKRVGTDGGVLVTNDILEEPDGTQWRYISDYSGYTLVREA